MEIRIPHDQAPNESLDEDDFSLMRRARDAETSDAPATHAITSAWREFDQPETVARHAEGPIELERLLIGVAPTIDRLGETRRGVGSSVEARLQDELYIHANRWHDAFRTWIEVVTAQDLDHVHRRWSADIEGASMATFTPAGVRTLSGGRIRLDTHDETPARPGLLRHALTEAGQQHYPPLAHVLLRDGRAAYWRGQMRRAVLDAATSTELSLHALAERHSRREEPDARTAAQGRQTLRGHRRRLMGRARDVGGNAAQRRDP